LGVKDLGDKTKPDVVLGKNFEFDFGEGKIVNGTIKETPTEVYLNTIGAKNKLNNFETLKGEGIGTKVINTLKEYADSTGKKLIVPDATGKAVPFWEKIPWLKRDYSVNVEGVLEGGRLYNPPNTFSYSPTQPKGVGGVRAGEAPIEKSVVQIVSKDGVEYKTIPAGQLEEFKKAIDTGVGGEVGIAGKKIDGKVYHLTAKTPEQMDAGGAKFGGEAKLEEIPTQATGTSKFQSKVFERLKAEHPQLQGELSYDPIKLNDQSQKAVELLATDRQKAFDIAMGKEPSREITSTAANIAMAEKALDEGNHDLYAKLIKNRSLAQTRRGQEIVSERGSLSDNSASRYVKELIATRLDNVGKTYLSDLREGKTTNKEHASRVIDRKVGKLEKDIIWKEFI